MIICYNLSRVIYCSNFSLNVLLNKLLRVLLLYTFRCLKDFLDYTQTYSCIPLTRLKLFCLFVEFRCKPQNSRTHF